MKILNFKYLISNFKSSTRSSPLTLHPSPFQKGFTLIEIMVVMGLTITLMAIAVISLTRPQSKASVSATTSTLVSDLRQQQLLSMLGDSGGQTTAQPHGTRLESNRYTLFLGSSFATSTNQFTINFPSGIILTATNLPLDIIFTKRSGETFLQNNIVITNQSGDQKTITISTLGVVNTN